MFFLSFFLIISGILALVFYCSGAGKQFKELVVIFAVGMIALLERFFKVCS